MEFASLLVKGGPVVYILLGLSVYVLSIVIYKLHILSKVNFFNSDVTHKSVKMWLNNNKEEAYTDISKDTHPQKEVVSFTMYHLLKNNINQDKERYLREEVSRLSQERLEYYDSNLDTLKVIAMVAPLLGLLGTVFGMIDAFQQMEMAGNNINPSTLSGGIWEALLTTAVGLSVAIPTVLFESYFRATNEKLKINIEHSVTKLLTAHMN
jgi:biopolymer transport protein ExbB